MKTRVYCGKFSETRLWGAGKAVCTAPSGGKDSGCFFQSVMGLGVDQQRRDYLAWLSMKPVMDFVRAARAISSRMCTLDGLRSLALQNQKCNYAETGTLE